MYRSFQFQKRSQLFIDSHNERLARCQPPLVLSVSTVTRISTCGVEVAVAVGVNVAVAVAVGIGVNVAVAVAVGLAVAVGSGVGVNVAVTVAVGVNVAARWALVFPYLLEWSSELDSVFRRSPVDADT